MSDPVTVSIEIDTTDIKGLIHDWADNLRRRVQGGTIAGIAVDMDNPDHLLAAVYSLGFADALEDMKNNLKKNK